MLAQIVCQYKFCRLHGKDIFAPYGAGQIILNFLYLPLPWRGVSLLFIFTPAGVGTLSFVLPKRVSRENNSGGVSAKRSSPPKNPHIIAAHAQCA